MITMPFLNSQAGAVSLRTKLGLFIIILVLAFAFLDVGPLRAVYSLIKYSHMQEPQLNELRHLLLKLYLLKALWLVALIGIAIGFGYWIIKPYKDKLSAETPSSGIKKFRRH